MNYSIKNSGTVLAVFFITIIVCWLIANSVGESIGGGAAVTAAFLAIICAKVGEEKSR